MASSNSKGDFVVGLLVGGALGAALALLYAPQSGDTTRDALKRKADDLQDTAADAYDKVKSQTTTLAAQVKDSTSSLAAQARETVGKVKDDVSAGSAGMEGVPPPASPLPVDVSLG